MEKQLVLPLLGLLTIFQSPVNIYSQSGISSAATKKLVLKKVKNSARNSRSGILSSSFSFFKNDPLLFFTVY